MDRQEKIQLIKDFAEGKINADDLKPKYLRLELLRPGETVAYIDNSEVSIEDWCAQHPKQGTPKLGDEFLDIIIDGVNMKDPDYHQKMCDRLYEEHPEYLEQMKKDNPHLFMPTNQPTNMSKEV